MNSQITTAETTSSFQPGAAGIPVPEETTGEASRPVGTERKSKSQALCEQAINRLAEALEAGQSEAIKQYLRVMSRFHHYSFSNQLLILVQHPEATQVAGYQRWKALGRQVRQGEKAIHILAPIARKPKPEEVNGDMQSGAPRQSTEARQPFGFRLAYVFDISQTVGKPLPEPPQAQGEPGANLEAMKALYGKHNIALEYRADLNGAEGLSAKGKVYILSGLEPAREFSVLVHELAHELLHAGERRQTLDRKAKETEAEAVAYVVGLQAGLDMNSASADYISLYNGDKDTLRQSLQEITRTAGEIIAALPCGTAA